MSLNPVLLQCGTMSLWYRSSLRFFMAFFLAATCAKADSIFGQGGTITIATDNGSNYTNLINGNGGVVTFTNPNPTDGGSGVVTLTGTTLLTFTGTTGVAAGSISISNTQPGRINLVDSLAQGQKPEAGNYVGLVHGDSLDTSGFVRAVINKSGRGTFSVNFGHGETGASALVWDGSQISSAKSNSPIQVALSPAALPGGGVGLSGTLMLNGSSIFVTLAKGTAPSYVDSVLGQYTVVFKSSQPQVSSTDVAGIGTLTVSKKGKVNFRGILNDGTLLVQKTTLDSSGGWPLYIKEHDGSIISGDITFSNESESDLSGTIHVQRLTEEAGAPDTDLALDLAGSIYDPSLAWSAASGWKLTRVEDGGSPETLPSDLSVSGNFLTNLTSLNALAIFAHSSLLGGALDVPAVGVLLDPGSGMVIGGYGVKLDELHAMIGVEYQKTHSAFGLTRIVDRANAANAILSAASFPHSTKKQVKQAITSASQAVKLGSDGTFFIQADLPNNTPDFAVNYSSGATLVLSTNDTLPSIGSTTVINNSGYVSGGTLTVAQPYVPPGTGPVTTTLVLGGSGSINSSGSLGATFVGPSSGFTGTITIGSSGTFEIQSAPADGGGSLGYATITLMPDGSGFSILNIGNASSAASTAPSP